MNPSSEPLRHWPAGVGEATLNRAAWPGASVTRVAGVWCIVGYVNDESKGIGPRGWYSVVLLGVEVDLDDPFHLIPHCTGATWGLRRRRDAVEAARQHLTLET